MRELDERLVSLSDELKALLANPPTAFERCVEAYVAKKAQDFFR